MEEEFNELAVTESYAVFADEDDADKTRPDRVDPDEAFDGSSEQVVVSADGEPWTNRVFRNTTNDPELFVTIEREDLELPAVTPTGSSKHSNAKLHNHLGKYQMLQYNTVNSNACLACLALHADGADGRQVTPDDSGVRQLEKHLSGDGATTAVAVLTTHEKHANHKLMPTSAGSPAMATAAGMPQLVVDHKNHRHDGHKVGDSKYGPSSSSESSGDSATLTVGERSPTHSPFN